MSNTPIYDIVLSATTAVDNKNQLIQEFNNAYGIKLKDEDVPHAIKHNGILMAEQIKKASAQVQNRLLWEQYSTGGFMAFQISNADGATSNFTFDDYCEMIFDTSGKASQYSRMVQTVFAYAYVNFGKDDFDNLILLPWRTLRVASQKFATIDRNPSFYKDEGELSKKQIVKDILNGTTAENLLIKHQIDEEEIFFSQGDANTETKPFIEPSKTTAPQSYNGYNKKILPSPSVRRTEAGTNEVVFILSDDEYQTMKTLLAGFI